MRLYDTITQSALNNVIDKLLGNFHRELSLDLDDSSNDYCSLEFDLSEGIDAGEEIIFNTGDELSISFTNQRLQGINYGIRFYYYQLDKGDYSQTKPYGELQSFITPLDDDTVTVPFNDNQIYLQKAFELVLMNTGESIILTADKNNLFIDEDLTLTAFYSVESFPVEGASVSFYTGETLLDTVVTDEDGEATLTLSDLEGGTYNFSCVCNGRYSHSIMVIVLTRNMIELEVTGTSFSTYSSTPFICNGKVFVDWGDNTGLIKYTAGNLAHNYNTNDDYTIKIYGDITSLQSSCFRDCTTLTSIDLPDTVTSLGNNCFYRCTNLSNVELSNAITSIGASCFYGCSSLTSIDLPDTVTSLGYNCFFNCTNLTSITLPATITSLPNSCFNGCSSLSDIELPDTVTNLGQGCFNGCSSLTSIDLPNSITSIGIYCFRNCAELRNITLNWITSTQIIPYNENWIPGASTDLLFHIPQGATNLYTTGGFPSNKIDDVTGTHIILSSSPDTITYGESVTFSAIVLDGSERVAGVNVSFYDDTTLLGTASTDTNGTATLTTSSLMPGNRSCTGKYNSIVSNSVSVIVNKIASTISISVPTSANADFAFDISGTVSVDSGSVKIYEGSSLVDTVTVSGGTFSKSVTKDTPGEYSYTAVFEGDATHSGTTSTSSSIVIKDYLKLTFTGTKLTQPQGTTNPLVGNNIVINYGDGTIVSSNGNYGHTYTDGVTTHTIKMYNVTSLGANCFNGCTGLTSVNIPTSVTSLGDSCFYECTGLTSITIPSSGVETRIEAYCFGSCTKLTSINIPQNVRRIGGYCFNNCTKLTSIKLNWTTQAAIVMYGSSWIVDANSNLKFHIPQGTTNLYTTKKYPSTKLVEDSS